LGVPGSGTHTQKRQLLGIIRASFLTFALLVFGIIPSHSNAAPLAPGRDPSTPYRTIKFAGLTWGVRSEYGSPGPNEWSDALSSVWVDELGRLHLKVTNVNGKWYAAEVFSYGYARYGPHRFTVVKDNPTLDQIDPNLVLGLFLFKVGCGSGCASEIDIEFSRWRNPNSLFNTQYIVQPSSVSGNRYRFPLTLSSSTSTHVIDWRSDRAIFSSYLGENYNNPNNLLQTWTYSGPDLPLEKDNMVIILDLWMDDGSPPADGKEAEVIIADAGLSTVCISAARLACGETVQASTSGPGARDQIERYPGSSWPEYGPEMAYSFIAPATGPVSLQLSRQSKELDMFVLNSGSGVCSSNNVFAYGNEIARFDAVEGTKYYVLVDGMEESGGSYDLQVDCSGAPLPPDPLKSYSGQFFPMMYR